MRIREEIEKSEGLREKDNLRTDLILEVLLDIREFMENIAADVDRIETKK